MQKYAVVVDIIMGFCVLVVVASVAVIMVVVMRHCELWRGSGVASEEGASMMTRLIESEGYQVLKMVGLSIMKVRRVEVCDCSQKKVVVAPAATQNDCLNGHMAHHGLEREHVDIKKMELMELIVCRRSISVRKL
jgi:hypothetical protein